MRQTLQTSFLTVSHQRSMAHAASEFFLPVLRETPNEAQIASHRFMLRAGMIRQSSAGSIPGFFAAGLPGAEEDRGHRPRRAEPYRRARGADADDPARRTVARAGRYDDYGKEMLRIKDRHGREMLYGPTNEEQITEIFRAAAAKSYRDVPQMLYHIQWKFRDEVRPAVWHHARARIPDEGRLFLRSGLRELETFLQQDVRRLPEDLERMGLKAIPMAADTGPIGGDLSHEFIILADTGRGRRCSAIAT